MRTRTEIELERTFHLEKMTPDGSEERMLLGLVVELLLDLRDQGDAKDVRVSAGGPSQGFGVSNVGAGRTPFEQG